MRLEVQIISTLLQSLLLPSDPAKPWFTKVPGGKYTLQNAKEDVPRSRLT